jgi:spermidine/putrescine transport system permease protein
LRPALKGLRCNCKGPVVVESWRHHARVFWAFSLLPTLWLVVFFLMPLALVWLLSFGEKRGIVDIAITGTLGNYWRALEPLYLWIFVKSFWFATLTTLICLMAAFPIAMVITFAPPRWKAWLLLLVVLPFWTNLLIRTYALIAVLRTKGYLNAVLAYLWSSASGFLQFVGADATALLGARFQPLELLYNNFAVVFGLVYVHLPFMVLPLYATLDRLDKTYLEASLDLGASQWHTFWYVVVPLALPGILSGVVITFIPALGSFLTPTLLGGPDSQLIGTVIERQFKSANDWPFGAALSFLLMYVMFFTLALRVFLSTRSAASEGH